MERKTFLIFSLIAIILISLIILIFLSNSSAGLSPSSLEECKTISYQGKNAVNLVFFSTQEEAKEYSDYLLTITPFKENPEALNFYYIDTYEPKCEIYKNIALLCYDKEILKKASSCPNDYIVVIQAEKGNIRSSAYMNVMSINSQHQLSVFPHEFGHAFATLAEEYTPAEIPKGAENCQASCEKFNSENDGCYQGCSKSNYYRSIDNGIMRTLSSEYYGIFNEKLIRERLTKSVPGITAKAISELNDCNKEKYVLVEGSYKNNKMELKNKTIETGCVSSNGNGFFDYKLITKDNSTFEGDFNPELIFTDVQEENTETIDGETYNNEEEFYLKIPSIENAKSLEVSKDSQKLAEINLENLDAIPCKIQ